MPYLLTSSARNSGNIERYVLKQLDRERRFVINFDVIILKEV